MRKQARPPGEGLMEGRMGGMEGSPALHALFEAERRSTAMVLSRGKSPLC